MAHFLPQRHAGPVTVAQYQAAVQGLLEPVLASRERVTVQLAQALGRVLATDIAAPVALPHFDNSQMDGYALRASESGAVLTVTGQVAAGSDPQPVPPGSAAPIMTGAAIPAGADAVVPVEQVPGGSGAAGFGEPGQTLHFPQVAAGTYIRSAGSDVPRGEHVLAAGETLTAAKLGLLAALGVGSVEVFAPLRIGVLCTGDELLPPGEPLQPGKIYSSNGVMLAAAVRGAGAEAVLLPEIPDDPAELTRVLGGQSELDLVISSGGISKGAREVIKLGLSDALEFTAIAMQPGGPQGLGLVHVGATDAGGQPIPFLAFPGNPVSGIVSWEMFLRPLLAWPRTTLRLPLAEAVDSPEGMHQVRRGRITDSGAVAMVGGPSSHLLAHLARAEALVHLPAGLSHAAAGQEVEVWLI